MSNGLSKLRLKEGTTKCRVAAHHLPPRQNFFGGQLVRCDGTGRKHLGCRRSLFKFQSAHTVVFVQFNSEKDARAAAQVSCRTSCVQVEAGEFFFSQYLSINDIVQTPSVFTNRRMGLYFISSGNILPISTLRSARRPDQWKLSHREHTCAKWPGQTAIESCRPQTC